MFMPYEKLHLKHWWNRTEIAEAILIKLIIFKQMRAASSLHLRPTSSLSRTESSWCSIGNDLSKHIWTVFVLSCIATCLVSHFCGIKQHYYEVMYLQSEKEIKSHEQERRKCRCKSWMNVGYQTERCAVDSRRGRRDCPGRNWQRTAMQ